MNFLAHLVLAPQTPHGLVGAIAPDLIRGPLPKDLHPLVRLSAMEHQRIDRFTDTHAAFDRTRRQLAQAVEPRLAAVVADVLYDHLLASNWSSYRPDAFNVFVASCHDTLQEHAHLMPDDMQAVVRKMIDERWLTSYATAAGLHDRLTQMSARLTLRFDRAVNLCPPIHIIEALARDCADDFCVFWPDLLSFVATQRSQAPADRLAS